MAKSGNVIEYEVEELSDLKFTLKRGAEVLIKWKGYDEPTWEPVSNLSEQSLLALDHLFYRKQQSGYPYIEKIKNHILNASINLGLGDQWLDSQVAKLASNREKVLEQAKDIVNEPQITKFRAKIVKNPKLLNLPMKMPIKRKRGEKFSSESSEEQEIQSLSHKVNRKDDDSVSAASTNLKISVKLPTPPGTPPLPQKLVKIAHIRENKAGIRRIISGPDGDILVHKTVPTGKNIMLSTNKSLRQEYLADPSVLNDMKDLYKKQCMQIRESREYTVG